MRITQVLKTIINEIGANVVVVMYPIRVVVLPTTIENSVTIATEIAGIRGEIETTTSASPLDHPRMRRTTTEIGATRIIITETTGEIATVTGTDAGIATGIGIGDIPEMTGRRIDTETNVRVITRRRIARGRGRDRGIARHYRSGQR